MYIIFNYKYIMYIYIYKYDLYIYIYITYIIKIWPVGWTEAGYVWTDGTKISVINPIKSHQIPSSSKTNWHSRLHDLIQLLFFSLQYLSTILFDLCMPSMHVCITMTCTMKAKWLFRWVSPE